eukprot:Skav211046  [mRNA]  locus=scaffold1434:319238:320440:- [translate_table: standard]
MQSPSARYIIVYFHCNGVDLGMCRGFCNVLRKQFRVHVLAVEYPGYGLHHGTPNPESIEETAHSAMDFILDHLHWPVDSVMIFGRSIGTGPAMALASAPGLAGLILVSPFLSVQDLVRDRIGSLAGFCEDFFVAKDAAPKVKCPTFILHGQADEVVSSNHGKTLYKMLTSRKLIVMPADMRHNSSLLSNLQHFVLPMFHFFSLPETSERNLQVPCWSYHRRLAAQRAGHPKLPRTLPEDDVPVPAEDCAEAEVESLSSKTTSESCGRQFDSFAPALQSWEAPAQQPSKAVVHFMRPRLADDEDVLHWSEDFPTTTPFPIPQQGCVVPICAAAPLFTQDAPEMIDADVCPTGLYLAPKSCACSLLSCSAKEVSWHTNFAHRGSYRHHDATVRVSYCSVVNL